MHRHELQPETVTFTAALGACASSAKWEKASGDLADRWVPCVHIEVPGIQAFFFTPHKTMPRMSALCPGATAGAFHNACCKRGCSFVSFLKVFTYSKIVIFCAVGLIAFDSNKPKVASFGSGSWFCRQELVMNGASL